MNYYAPDKGWAFSDYPPHLLDLLAGGDKLTLRNNQGVVVVAFDLQGFSQSRAVMKSVCGF